MAGNTEYKNQWKKEHTDQKLLTMPKGRKADIQAAANAIGEKLNDFILKAIDERMERLEYHGKEVFEVPAGEWCPEDCKKRGEMFPNIEVGTPPKHDYDEKTRQYRKCKACYEETDIRQQ
jgi:hypothetical protein